MHLNASCQRSFLEETIGKIHAGTYAVGCIFQRLLSVGCTRALCPGSCRLSTEQGGHTMVAPPSLSRRSFLKISTGGFAVGGVMSLVDVRSTQARAQSLKTAGVKEIPGVCPYCAVGCGMLVGVN